MKAVTIEVTVRRFVETGRKTSDAENSLSERERR